MSPSARPYTNASATASSATRPITQAAFLWEGGRTIGEPCVAAGSSGWGDRGQRVLSGAVPLHTPVTGAAHGIMAFAI